MYTNIVSSTVYSLQSTYPNVRLNDKERHFAQIICMLIVTLRINRKLLPKQSYPAGDRAGGQGVFCVRWEQNVLCFVYGGNRMCYAGIEHIILVNFSDLKPFVICSR